MTAPLNEKWGTHDVAVIGGAVIAILVGAPILLAVLVDWKIGAMVLCAGWFVAMGYESGMIPHLKWEVRRRLFPTAQLSESENKGEK